MQHFKQYHLASCQNFSQTKIAQPSMVNYAMDLSYSEDNVIYLQSHNFMALSHETSPLKIEKQTTTKLAIAFLENDNISTVALRMKEASDLMLPNSTLTNLPSSKKTHEDENIFDKILSDATALMLGLLFFGTIFRLGIFYMAWSTAVVVYCWKWLLDPRGRTILSILREPSPPQICEWLSKVDNMWRVGRPRSCKSILKMRIKFIGRQKSRHLIRHVLSKGISIVEAFRRSSRILSCYSVSGCWSFLIGQRRDASIQVALVIVTSIENMSMAIIKYLSALAVLAGLLVVLSWMNNKLMDMFLTPTASTSLLTNKRFKHWQVSIILYAIFAILNGATPVAAADVPGGNSINVDTPTKVANNDLTAKHRAAFNKKVFGISSDGAVVQPPKTGNTSKIWTDEGFAKRLHVCDPANWGVGNICDMDDSEQKKKFIEFRKKHKKDGNNWTRKFTVVESTLPQSNTKIKRLVELKTDPKTGNKVPGRLIVPRDAIFDCIDEIHEGVGHMKRQPTHSEVKKQYWNITEQLVNEYLDLCPICNAQQPRVPKPKGAAKPIVSHAFRDRFQVDLIDMRKRRKRNVYSVMMRWIMTVKDHSTGMTYLAALPVKQAKCVAYELDLLFGLIGYPSIFHTDNGTEFTANEIVELLKQISPNIQTVTGRVRKPSDQGSVENMNNHVKRVLRSIETSERNKGRTPNWTSLLGRVMAALNKTQGTGKHDVSAYMAVFGMEYDLPLRCSMAEMRKCRTIDERLALAPDGRLETVARAAGDLPPVSEDGDSSEESVSDTARRLDFQENHWDWEEDNAPDLDPPLTEDEAVVSVLEESDGASNACIEEHIEGCKDAIAGIEHHEKEIKKKKGKMNTKSSGNAVKSRGEKNHAVSKDDSILSSSTLKKGKTTVHDVKSKEEKNAGDYQTLANVARKTLKKMYSVVDAWQNKKALKVECKYIGLRRKTYQFVYATLECTCCFAGSNIIPIGNEQYHHDNMNTRRWYDFDFISGFAALVAHEAHMDERTYSQSNMQMQTQLVHCHWPEGQPAIEECRDLPSNNERVVSVLHNRDHYSVLVMEKHEKVIKIFDGLSRPLTDWKNHVVNILKITKLIHRLSAHTHECHDSGKRSEHIIITVDGQEWSIQRGWFRKQIDGYNCGPIACLKIMELFDCSEYRIMDDETLNDVSCYRSIVMQKFENLVKRCNHDLNVSVPVELFDIASVEDASKGTNDTVDEDNGTVNCFCMQHSKHVVVMMLSCCGQTLHKACLAHWLKSQSTCVYCRGDILPDDVIRCTVADEDAASVDEVRDSTSALDAAVSCNNNVTSLPMDASKDEFGTPIRPAHVAQKHARQKKRDRQEQQSKVMKRRHQKAMIEKGVVVGAVVTVKMDIRDVSHPHGIQGVVVSTNGTGGVIVCSQWGVLVQGVQKREYWIPRDRYKVVYEADHDAVVSDELDNIKAEVLNGTFDRKKVSKVTLQEAHRNLVGETPQGKRKCTCKKGKCTPKCGCWRNKISCSSGCVCHGNCINPHNFTMT